MVGQTEQDKAHVQGFPAGRCFAGAEIELPRDGHIKLETRTLLRTTRNPVLTISTLLTLALLGISLIAYLRSRPNTGGAASLGPFDGEHAFADLGKSSRSAQGPQAR